MSINPAGMQQTSSNYWNYTKPDKPDYSTTLVGTVVAIQEVQKRTFNPNGPGMPEFWPDGNPKFNIRLVLVDSEGQLKLFTFQPAGKAAREGRKKSIHMDLFSLTGNTDMHKLIGQTIGISTQEGVYGLNNPRPWSVGLVEAGPFTYAGGEIPAEYQVEQVLCNDAVSGGQIQQPTQQQQQPQYQQQYAQPVVQQQYAAPQPQQYAYPQGMNPSVAQAMQQLGVAPQQVQTAQQAQPAVGMAYNDLPC